MLRKPAWMASLAGLGDGGIVVAAGVYGMPLGKLLAAVTYGAAFGLFPIGWVVFSAILLYRITLESGKFELLKDSIGHLTSDPRLQALLIAFAFGAFVEGAAGFGTPVAVAAAMLVGLGFEPFYAAAICLLANTAPVAFGSIAIPITTLAGTTGLPLDRLSAGVGRICAPVSLIRAGLPDPGDVRLERTAKAVLPAAAVCGVAFAGTQFVVSNFINAQLTDILASLAAIGVADRIDSRCGRRPETCDLRTTDTARERSAWPGRRTLCWWSSCCCGATSRSRRSSIPPIMLVNWPGLHNTILRMPPVVAKPSPYPAVYNFSWLSASGTACLFAAILAAIVAGLKPRQFAGVLRHTARQLALAEL